MLLQDLQGYLQTHRQVSLTKLCQHWQMDADALRPVLNLLIRKGRVRCLHQPKCGGCHSCAATDLELYEWVEQPP
ncbi:FeoC-like transcriptional regulator [Gloeomargarita sp.]